MLYQNKNTSQWTVEIDRLLDSGDGSKRRVRKVKRLPLGTTPEEAKIIAHTIESKIFNDYTTISAHENWDAMVDEMLIDKNSWLHKTNNRCRDKTSKNGKAHTITVPILANLLRQTRGRCQITGLKFSLEEVAGSKVKPYGYSLDRIDSRIGYTPENCRVVCFAVNVSMLNWGEAIFAKLATGYVFNQYGRMAALGVALDK